VNLERYKESITTRFGSIEKFEQDLRDEIAQDKLKAFLSAGVNVSDEEVKTEFIRSNTNFDVSYVVVSADKIAEKIQPSDEELRSYYEAHKTNYRFDEPQRRVHACALIL
jgi:peptidyl-prolyl cis-trans isomerase D